MFKGGKCGKGDWDSGGIICLNSLGLAQGMAFSHRSGNPGLFLGNMGGVGILGVLGGLGICLLYTSDAADE